MTHDPLFITAAQRLMVLMSAHELSTPLSISWRNAYGAPPTLHVQIAPREFKRWLDELDSAVYSAFDDVENDARHMHAEGVLRVSDDVRLHIVAVASREELVKQ
jgi:hypothetical protein